MTAIVSTLETVHAFSDPLAVAAIGAFAIAILLARQGRVEAGMRVGGLAWGLFGAFWLAMFPYFYLEFASPLESVLSLAAVPLCVYTGYLLASGRQSLLLLSKAVAIMGAIYLPVMLIPPLEEGLIELVAAQTHTGMEVMGYSPGLEEGANGFHSQFGFAGYTTYIVLACTGIGSMAIFGGLIAATTAPLRRKTAAFGLAVGIIWILNIGRNVFVGLAAPLGWFEHPLLAQFTATFAGEEMRTSFFVSHHLISQPLAVVALIGITLIVIRIVPEVLDILEEALFVLTGSDWNLGRSRDVDIETG